MDRADAFSVPGNPWSLVRGYFSPATLFLLLNAVIGTIALTSRSHRRRDDDYHHYCTAPPPLPAPIARTSSMMERLRSFGLYRFRSGDFPPEYNHHFSASADSASNPSSEHHDHHQYSRSRSEPAARPPAPVRNADNKKVEPVVTSRAVKKSSSEARKMERAPVQPRRVQRAPPRAPVAVREVVEDAAAVSVDARADDFINRFRQQLQLQRLNSLLNYKEMLNRGL